MSALILSNSCVFIIVFWWARFPWIIYYVHFVLPLNDDVLLKEKCIFNTASFFFIFQIINYFLLVNNHFIKILNPCDCIRIHTKFENQVIISHTLLTSYAKRKIFKQLITFSCSTWSLRGEKKVKLRLFVYLWNYYKIISFNATKISITKLNTLFCLSIIFYLQSDDENVIHHPATVNPVLFSFKAKAFFAKKKVHYFYFILLLVFINFMF